jgi:hypothetical protein
MLRISYWIFATDTKFVYPIIWTAGSGECP